MRNPSLIHHARGASSIEHVLVILLVALAAMGGWVALGDSTAREVRCAAAALSAGGGGPCRSSGGDDDADPIGDLAPARGADVGRSRGALSSEDVAHTLDVLDRRFGEISGGDDLVTASDLSRAASSTDAELRDAALALQSSEPFRAALDLGAGRGELDEQISHDDVTAMRAALDGRKGDGAAAEAGELDEHSCEGWTDFSCHIGNAASWAYDTSGLDTLVDVTGLDDAAGAVNRWLDENVYQNLGPLQPLADFSYGLLVSGPAKLAVGLVDGIGGLIDLGGAFVQNLWDDPIGTLTTVARFATDPFYAAQKIRPIVEQLASYYWNRCTSSAQGAGECTFEAAVDIAALVFTGGTGNVALHAAEETAELGAAARTTALGATALDAATAAQVAGEVPPLVVIGKTGVYNWLGDGELQMIDDAVEVAGGTVGRGGGGVATAVQSMQERAPQMITIAQPARTGDQLLAQSGAVWRVGGQETAFVQMSADVTEGFTYTSAELLWMWQHRLPAQITWSRNWETEWAGYMEAQRAFAARALEQSARTNDALFVVNDFQMYGVPELIRAAKPEAQILHFTHIPFPDAEEWVALGARLGDDYVPATIARSLLGSDVAGFQTARDAENFVDTALHYVPGARATRLDDGGWLVTTPSGSETLVRDYAISVDASTVRNAVEVGRASTSARKLALDAYVDGLDHTIVSVARLDPMKNVRDGLLAYERLLETRPDLAGHVGLVEMLVPTRTEVPVYSAYQDATLQTIERINARFGTADWQPIHYVYDNQPYSDVLYAMSRADVQFIPSGWDGMNLTAKEAMIANPGSAMVISERVGAANELAPFGAVTLDPDDFGDITRALEQGIDMSPAARASRGASMAEHIEANGLEAWIQRQLDDVRRLRADAPR